jgi:uncharacterized protein
MIFWEVVLLITGGLAAGVINTMAGGASALTVPLLVLAGVPGNQANGSNRVGVLAASASSLVSFRKSGVDGFRNMRTILVPAVLGSLLGSFGISQLADETFETIFGYLLVPIILLTIFKPKPHLDAEPWSTQVTVDVWRGVPGWGWLGSSGGTHACWLRPCRGE